MSAVVNLLLLLSQLAMVVTAFITVYRLTVGPSIMDRAVASDVLAVASVGITLLVAVRTDRTDVLVLAIMFSMVGFMYSVTLGRFSERPHETSVEKVTEEEARAEEARLIREAQNELHAEERAAIRAAREARAAAMATKTVADLGARVKDASNTAARWSRD